RQFYVDEHTNSKTELSEVTDSVKEEEKQNDVTEAMETDLVAPAAIKSAGDENDDTNDKFLDNEKTTKSTHDWWRGEQLKQR
ncbi:hypothetical protein NL478_27665, partial [Klebsiella pneumoniae]|nr:hypothetical protein [Klebsiella pneumoniae]